MVHAKSPLNQKLRNINMDRLEMDWKELRQRILDAHKPIKDLFFRAAGNKLQFKDSYITENIILQFAEKNHVALPIHDSFLMREGFAGDFKEAMRRAFYDEF